MMMDNGTGTVATTTSSWIVDGSNQRLEADLRVVCESRLRLDEKRRNKKTQRKSSDVDDDAKTGGGRRQDAGDYYLYKLHLKNVNERYFSSTTTTTLPQIQQNEGGGITKENTTINLQQLLPDLLEKLHWEEITWVDCEGLLQFFLFPITLNTKRLTLYRISPPPSPIGTSLFVVENEDVTTTTSSSVSSMLGINAEEEIEEQSELLQIPTAPTASFISPTSSINQNNKSMIQVLNLEHCVLDVMATKHLSTFLTSTKTQNLITISFKSCFWLENQDMCINNLIEGFESRRYNSRRRDDDDDSLKNVIFFWSNILDNQLDRLISSLPSSVDTLDLSGNLCRTQGMISIAEQWLQLTSSTTTTSRFPPSSAATTTKKSMLRLREQCIDIGSKLDIRPLIESSRSNNRTILNSLIHLDISVNRLSDDDMILLSDAITMEMLMPTSSTSASTVSLPSTKHIMLQILDVRSNNISDIGVEALCRISSLRQLHLQDNEAITKTGACHLYQAAKRYGNLEVVGLSQRFDHDNNDDNNNDTSYDDDSDSSDSEEGGNGESDVDDADDGDVEQIQVLLDYYTMLNWGGRRLLLEENSASFSSSSSLPLSVWPLVFERASKQDGIDCAANILFYLLRWGPVLWAK